MIKLKKIPIESILDYFLCFMLVLNSQSVYQNASYTNYHTYEITLFAIVITSIYKIFKYGIKVNTLKKVIFFNTIYFIILFYFIILSVPLNQFILFASRYFSIPFVMIYMLCNSSFQKKIDFFSRYINVVCIVAVISLFFWLFGTFLHIIVPNTSFTFLWGSDANYASYYNLYFETQWIDWLDTDIKRNTAIFVEGPCYAEVIGMALLFLYYFKNNIKFANQKLLILFITSITTFSITLYAVLFTITFLFIISNNKHKNIKLLAMIFVPVIIVALFIVMSKKMSTGSYSLRSTDSNIILKSWLLSPIYGNGYGDAKSIAALVSNRKNLAVASSWGAILMQGGIMYASVYFIPIFKSLIYSINKKSLKTAIIAILYFLFLTVILFQTFYINFYMWTFLLFCEKYDKKIIKVGDIKFYENP